MKSHKKIRIIACYSPTATNASANEAAQFYDLLTASVMSWPKRDVAIIMGNLNASLPQDVIRAPWSVGEPNENAPLLNDLMVSLDLISINSVHKKPMQKRNSFIGPNNRLVRLDHILITRKWKRSVRNHQVINTRLLKSDHMLVLCPLRTNEQLYQPPRSPPGTHWASLRDQDIRQEFTFQINHRLRDINSPSYEQLAKAIMTTADDCLPRYKTRCRPGLPWSRDKAVDEARYRWVKATESSERLILQKKAELDYKKVTEEFIRKETENIAKTSECGRVRVAWNLLRRFTGKKTKESSLQVNGDSPEERLENVRVFFSQLLDAPPLPPTSIPESVLSQLAPLRESAHFSECRITPKEVCTAAWKIAAGKAPGPDKISIESLRLPTCAFHLARIMNDILLDGKPAPNEWTKSIIVPIPKKRGARSLDQHRGISLMSLAAKVFNRIILDRLRPVIDPWLRKEQNGFRKERSTVQHILALRRICEEAKAHKQELHMIFIDFRKAFDSVARAQLPTLLDAYGVPPKLQFAICSLYENTESYVRTKDGVSDAFHTQSGVLQGDVLAPFLFTLYIDMAMRIAIPTDEDGFILERKRSRRHSERSISVLAYADDLVLTSSTAKGAQAMLTRLEETCKPLGLLINCSKTKAVSLNAKVLPQFMTHEGQVDHCNSFLYLGSIVPSSTEDFERRKSLAWAAAGKLKPLWLSGISLDAKNTLFQSIIEPILSYAAETWTINPALERKIDGTHSRLLRFIRGISWRSKKTNACLYKEAKIDPLSVQLRKRRKNLVADVTTMPAANIVLSSVLLWCIGPSSGQSHSTRNFTFLEQLERDAASLKVDLNQWLFSRDT